MSDPNLTPDILSNKLRLIQNNSVPDCFTTSLNETFEWIWLPHSVAKDLLAIRNAEHVLSSMRDSLPITMEAHLNFLQKYSLLQRIDFVLVHTNRGQYVGGMNISLTSNGFEIGKYIGNSDYLGRGIAYQMSLSVIRFVKENFCEITKIRAVTRIDNFKNINLNFKLGFRIIQRVEQDYWLMELE